MMCHEVSDKESSNEDEIEYDENTHHDNDDNKIENMNKAIVEMDDAEEEILNIEVRGENTQVKKEVKCQKHPSAE